MSDLFDLGYYTEDDLKSAGFCDVGLNVRVSKRCAIIGVEHISIGSNVRIDDFTTIIASDQASCKIGSYVHIASYCYISAGAGFVMEDFTGLSHGVKIYTKSDDYSGKYLTNPTVPAEYTSVQTGAVKLEKHAILGSGATVMPGIIIGEGVAVGALSLVTKNLDAWGVYFGLPAKKIKNRSKKLLDLEEKLKKER